MRMFFSCQRRGKGISWKRNKPQSRQGLTLPFAHFHTSPITRMKTTLWMSFCAAAAAALTSAQADSTEPAALPAATAPAAQPTAGASARPVRSAPAILCPPEMEALLRADYPSPSSPVEAGEQGPPAAITMRVYQWLKVPAFPGRTCAFCLHNVGVCSDGKTGGVGAPDFYIMAEYGGSSPNWREESDGARYMLADVLTGHSPRLSLHDLDQDGLPELVVQYLTPTDSPRLAIYALRAKGAERHPHATSAGLSPIVRNLPKSLVRVCDDGSFYLRDAWHPEMVHPCPDPVRYVLRDGQPVAQPAEEQPAEE